MATWSEWFQKAKEKGFPLEDFLKVNTEGDITRLANSGLPCFDMIIFDGDGIGKSEIKEFSKKYESTWVRVVNKRTKQRFYKIGIKDYDGLISYLNGLNINLNDYVIQLFENCNNEFGGNVITDKDKTVIEIVKGNQDIVGKSKAPFFHGFLNEMGRLVFVEAEVPPRIISAARNVLNYLRESRTSYLRGYFEFTVSDKGKVYFLDYKLGFH